VAPRSKGDEDVEVKVAQFVRLETSIAADPFQDSARIEPVFRGWDQDWMISFQILQRVALTPG
jgi:hypothetical protein